MLKKLAFLVVLANLCANFALAEGEEMAQGNTFAPATPRAQAENSLQQSGKKITYEGKDIQKPLPITRFMPKKQFFALMSEYKKFREQQNQSQEQKENVA